MEIRNIAIISHIDHGKSTLSDRLIEICGSLPAREMKDRILDSMDLERERGITIKLNSLQLKYGENTIYLIDTPGHTDFNYEVSRSLSACEGAVLLVDCTQGIQAQTISNYHLSSHLVIIPVLNKVDLPSANVEGCLKQLEERMGIDKKRVLLISAKTGFNCDLLLKRIIKEIPPPIINDNAVVRALIFDSFYDKYKGVVVYVRVKEGVIKLHDKMKLLSNGESFEVAELGIKTPKFEGVPELSSGHIGWLCGNIKSLKTIKVGDTITSIDSDVQPLEGFSESVPMVFCSLFPSEGDKYHLFKVALEKLSLSDSSLSYEYESSTSLGFGARCGFLGLLHIDIVKERIVREFGISVIISNPSVKYKVTLKNGSSIFLSSPSLLPDVSSIQNIQEPHINLSISTSEEYIGNVMKLCESFNYQDMECGRPYILRYEAPLSSIIYDFYNKLKSLSNGYASMDYSFAGYRVRELVKVDFLLNNQKIDALSLICEKKESYNKSRAIVNKLKDSIPKHLFEIAIQACINKRVISRETIKATARNVAAKCYGGDISRKKKLWAKQKEGKKKMKAIGSVNIPHSLFEKVLSN